LLRHATEPTRFMLYEAYESDDAAKAHKQTAHYAAWRDAVIDWMAKPREGVPYEVIRPAARDLW
jgi:autoinducer 2-degrading protein